jgi:hypothetical protein
MSFTDFSTKIDLLAPHQDFYDLLKAVLIDFDTCKEPSGLFQT